MAPGADSSLELLERGRRLIQALSFQAADRDSSLEAFETFRRAALRVLRGACPDGLRALDEMEPKMRLLEFLLDFAGRYISYRSRVAEVLRGLLTSGSWSTALQADTEMSAAVQGLVAEAQVGPSTPRASRPAARDLGKAAAVAASCGDLGALSVRVLAAHHLLVGQASDCSKLCVAVTLGHRTSRTGAVQGSLHPRWSSEELVFDVASSDWLLKLELLDGDAGCDACFGRLSVSLAAAMRSPGPIAMRCPLDDLPHGELEFALQYAPGGPPAAEPAPDRPLATDAAPEPAAGAPWSGPPALPTAAGQAAASASGSDPWSSAPAGPRSSAPADPWSSAPVAGIAGSAPPPCVLPAAATAAAPKPRAGRADQIWGQIPSAAPAPRGCAAATAHAPAASGRDARRDPWAASQMAQKSGTPTPHNAASAATNPFKTSVTPAHRITKVSKPAKGGATPKGGVTPKDGVTSSSRKLKLSTNPFKMVDNVVSHFGG